MRVDEVVMPVRFIARLVVAFVKVLVVLVTNAVMFPIISRRTIPGGPRRVVVVAPPPSPSPARGLVARADVVVMGELGDRELLRGGIVLLNPGPLGVELRGMVEVELGRKLELEYMAELEDGWVDELLDRMLKLDVEVAGLANDSGVEVVGPGGMVKHSVTVFVALSNGQLVIVTVAMGTKQLLNVKFAVLVMVIGGWVVTLGGQAAQSAVAISQMAVDGVGGVDVIRHSNPAFSSRWRISTFSPRTGELVNKMEEEASKAQRYLANMVRASEIDLHCPRKKMRS